MIVIEDDKTPRKVELIDREIEIIIDELERMPHNVFTFLNCDMIIEKFKKAYGGNE